MSSENTKECNKCHETKSLSRFGKYEQSADGLSFYCKRCVNEDNSRRYGARQVAAGKIVGDRGVARAARGPVPAGCKWCKDCGAYLPVTDFPKNRSTPDGFASYCKTHQNARSHASRIAVHGGSRHYHLVRRYGVTAAQIEDRIVAQAGLCVICRRALGTKPHVDHDHETGDVRGILCFNCNGGLGQFGDNLERLERAQAYLRGSLLAPSRIAPGVYEVEGSGWRDAS